MEALRTWIIEGDNKLTISVHRPALTIQIGNGPPAPLTLKQVIALYSRLETVETYFECEDPEVLD
ncbi:hypothetical protein [Fodinicola acaciae]|uniref:hypothetical protein n=1 Tax=Fodinicola acaciae TaxID=2681555 RepID=UPI0013D41342|nr:hypothetical protein [Fodinicola acaciae]